VKLIVIRAPLRAIAQYPAPEWILAPRHATFRDMDTPKITAYLKTTCGWSAGVRAVLAKYNLQYTEKDIIQNPAFRWEMETKSGQPLSPCVEINDKMLADISGEEVEEYLIENKIVQPNAADAGVPINAPCATEQHDSAVQMRL
jgi:monothiol glutaredoxin